MPPPAPAPPGAELPLIVLLVMTIGPVVTLKMPPPLAVLPLMVLLRRLTVPVLLLKMAPPVDEAVLLFRVLLLMLTKPVLKLRTPPPNPAELLLSALLLMLTVAVLLLRIPPPELPLGTFPFEIVKPKNVTSPGLASVTLKTRLLLFPLIVNRFAPGPWNVRLLSSTSSAEVRVMGLVTWLMSKVIVLPGQALLMIARREPAPL